MGLKKRNKVSPQFNMASLTDMIFLLLIFFILNSAVVAPSSLNLKLPGTSRSTVQADSRTPDVRVNKSGRFYLDGKRITSFDLEKRLSSLASRSSEPMSLTISPEENTPIKHVAFIMNIAMKYEINAILAAEN
ncbi:MAG: biopolymer transporter ExbD [Bacteroidota bacterium]